MERIKSLTATLKSALKTNRILRTFIQAAGAYIAMNLPAIVEGGGDLTFALETLLLGSLAAGCSAIWKTDIEPQNGTGK